MFHWGPYCSWRPYERCPCRQRYHTQCDQKSILDSWRKLDCEASLLQVSGMSLSSWNYCGVDYFGPFFIKQERKEAKRYGAICSCLASRAVHIETADSLETDSFLNAIRRFIARRGPVHDLSSDQTLMQCSIKSKCQKTNETCFAFYNGQMEI